MVRRALVLLALAGCTQLSHEEQACDDLFAWATVTVRDTNGAPVPGLVVHTIRTSDGVELTPLAAGFPDEGVYAVLDDNNLRDLDPDGSDLSITIGGATFGATGFGGGCHIVYDGPHELVLP